MGKREFTQLQRTPSNYGNSNNFVLEINRCGVALIGASLNKFLGKPNSYTATHISCVHTTMSLGLVDYGLSDEEEEIPTTTVRFTLAQFFGTHHSFPQSIVTTLLWYNSIKLIGGWMHFPSFLWSFP